MLTAIRERPLHVIEVAGNVDVAKAARIRDEVLALDPDERAVVDLREVRELDDAAVAFLAWSLFTPGRYVDLRGLTEHHRRLLRYLGVLDRPTDTGDPPAASDDSAGQEGSR